MRGRSEDAQIEERRLDAAARMTRVSTARVRYYVRVGLVRPARIEGADVFFGEPELARLRRIRRLQDDLGINPAGVEVVMRLVDEIEALREALAERRGR